MSHVDVHAARAAGLRPAAKPSFLQQRFHLHRDTAHVGPLDAGPRIEVDPQLVGMLEIAGAHRMRMQLDAAEVHDPGQAGRVVDDDFFRGAARGKESVTVRSHEGRSGARF